jgi:hypothetical protein
MDPIIIDPAKALGSIVGIVGLTMTLVHIIKRQCGDIPYLNKVPVFAYAWVVSLILTYVAHTVIHAIEGDLSVLMVHSVISTILAAGTIEIFRNGTKPIEDTRAARIARVKRQQKEDQDGGTNSGDS